MKKRTSKQLNIISKNLDKIFNLATAGEIKKGLSWYKSANQFCMKYAKMYNTTPLVVASIVSALSPRNKWNKNLIDTITVLESVANGIPVEEVKVSTFHTNKYKAFQICKGLKRITEESRKTYNFVRNIAYLDNQCVTVDVWHLRACLFSNESIKSASIGKLAYDQIKELTIKKAETLGFKGYEYQAIIWLSCQRNVNLLD